MNKRYTKPILRAFSEPLLLVAQIACWSGNEAIGGQCANGGKACNPCHPGYLDYCFPPK